MTLSTDMPENRAETTRVPSPVRRVLGRRRVSGRRSNALILPVTVYYLFALLMPMVIILVYSVDQPRISLENYTQIFTNASYRKLFVNTFKISLIVTVITAILSYPYAYVMSRLHGRAALILGLFVLLPFLSSSVVRSFTWGVILQPSGLVPEGLRHLGFSTPPQLIGNSTGVIIGMCQIELPFLIFPIYTAFLSVRQEYLFAAASLGASAPRQLRHITLPMTAPGLLVGSILVFISTSGYYVTPQVLGGSSGAMIGQVIAFQINSQLNWGQASAVGVILLASTAILIAAVLKLNRGRGVLSI